jgi:hypothetical protein
LLNKEEDQRNLNLNLASQNLVIIFTTKINVMKNLITEEFKEKFKAAFARFMNITIVASTLIAGFGLGYYFNELKMKPKSVNETILNKEVRIAIDSEDKLIMMDRKTGSYTIYSDSVGRIIFKMYASKIANPVQ